MSQNFLQLNRDKTEIIIFGNKEPRQKIARHLNTLGLQTTSQARNLGVLIDSDLNFDSHIKSITKSSFYHLKNIARVRGFMSRSDLETLIHAFISSRVDYCNALFTGLPKKSIKRLQLIQNAAARLLTRTKRSTHITPILKSLHWLPVQHRIDFKVMLTVYKSLNGLGPKYIRDMLKPYKPKRPLRSSGLDLLSVPKVKNKSGESAFSFYATRSWNKLPFDLRHASSISSFKSGLKTLLFSKAFSCI